MSLNDTDSTGDSSSTMNSVFYCPEAPNFKWNLIDTSYAWSLIVIRSIIAVGVIILNALAIITMQKKKVLHKHSNIMLTSMAFTDLFIGIPCVPLSVTVDVLILRQQVSFGHICTLDIVSVCLIDFLGLCSLYHLTVIAWERYIAIRKWMDYKVIVTTGRVKMLIIAGWLLTSFIIVPILAMRLAGVNHTVVEGWFVGQGIFGLAFLVLLPYLYIMVYLGVRKRKRNEISIVSDLVKAKRESKVAKTTAMLTAVVIFSFLPSGAIWFGGSSFPVLYTNLSFRTVETLAQLNSLINPILYCYRDHRFKKAVLELLGMRNPAIHPAVVATPYVIRKVPRGSPGLGPKMRHTEKRANLLRSKSFDEAADLDNLQQNNNFSLKRSMSLPTVDTKHY